MSDMADEEIETLDEILHAVSQAVKDAQHEMQKNCEEHINYYFPNGESKMVKVSYPLPNGEMSEREVPLFALVPHREMTIDEVNPLTEQVDIYGSFIDRFYEERKAEA